MPGFGFSTPLVGAGWTMARVARTYDTLMRRLGYESYGTHGSDGGAMVSRELAVLDPPGFLGAHVLQLFSFPSGDPASSTASTPEGVRRAGVPRLVPVGRRLQPDERHPAADHRGRAVGLAGRPARLQRAVRELRQRHQPGLAGAGADPGLALLADQHLGDRGPLPLRGGARRDASRRSATAGSASRCSRDDFQTIRPLAERDNAKIVHWSEFDRGGHYAALEAPDLVVGDLRTFFA